MLYPTGIQSFERIRTGGFVYVDKTAHIYRMASGSDYYFLSRPRRFGKSLLVSTMEAYFRGRRELFEGLAIDGLEKEWKSYPVLRFDMTGADYGSVELLDQNLSSDLGRLERRFGLEQTEELVPKRFESLIERLHSQTGSRVVVLIDEYDKPLLENIKNPALQDALRTKLGNFYSVLKKSGDYLRFVFLTGVTKFSKLSLFSDVNNLKDLSLSPKYSTVCGITDAELHSYFDAPVEELAQTRGETKEETYAVLEKTYDGYHFTHNAPGVYNPFSIINAFDNMVIDNYWYQSGTPSYLMSLLQANDYLIENLHGAEATAEQLGSVDAQSLISVFFQSGYLTIKGYKPAFNKYILDYPNSEVEASFTLSLAPHYLTTKESEHRFDIEKFVEDVRNGRPREFMERMQWLFDDSCYQIMGDKEKYFQNCIYLIFKLMGMHVQVEHATTRGRIDVSVRTEHYAYVIECKIDSSADAALEQIRQMGYAAPFENEAAAGRLKKVFRIGVNFSTQNRSIAGWKMEE